MRTVAVVAVAGLILTSCGGDDSSIEDTTAQEVTEPTSEDATATVSLETQLVTDLVYHAVDDRFTERSGLTDVIAPAEGGPWPTVVVFHGDPRSVSKSWHRSDATLIAESGRVVFLPAWGHTTLPYGASDLANTWDVSVQEVTCAVAFAAANTAEYGGDPDHITLYGLSAGGNAVLMAGLAGADLLDTCAVDGPAVAPNALVPIEADWVLGGGWDQQLSEDPEAFYSITPWRFLDGSQDIPIHVVVAESTASRSVEPDPSTSWLADRHADIDLPGELEELGFLADGSFGNDESGEYAYQVLLDAGYDAEFIVLPGATHSSWPPEARDLVVDTVLHAE